MSGNPPPGDTTPCRAGQAVVAVGPRGEVWPCNSLPVECGNLRTQSFNEVVTESASLRAIRSATWNTIEECRECELRSYCSRCHAMALYEDGKMLGPSLQACRHAVLKRDLLREQGLIPQTETALPPTWDRLQRDSAGRRRVGALRVLP
jgi:radical SAM protein with 4Fe4S-binding SPASM domain